MFQSRRLFGIVFLLALIAGFIGRTLYYYPGPLRIAENPINGFYRGPEVAESTPPSIDSLAGLSDVPGVENGEGQVVLVDQAHNNGFDQSELGTFAGSLASDGAQIVFVEDSTELLARLSEADALLIIAPDRAFDTEELSAINQFVVKGGKLIIVGEPTRQSSVDDINTLTGGFGIIYQDAYIYELTNNESGFRDVVLTNFADDSPLTEGVEEVVFSTAYALRTDEANGVIFGGDNTYSSRSEEAGGVIAAALAGDGAVLALPDFTFFTTPYNSYADNERLLANIAAFALSGSRGFDLADFPYFFTEPTSVVYENPVTLNETFEDSVALRERLAQIGTQAALADEVAEDTPFIYVGLYDDASDDVLDLLGEAGVEISDEPISDDADDSVGTIAIEGVARLEMDGTVLVHLLPPTEDQADYRLVVLAGDPDTLSEGIARLLAGDLGGCQVTPVTAVCRSDSDSGGGSGGTDGGSDGGDDGGDGNIEAILIVSDDQGIPGETGTGAEEVQFMLDTMGFENDIYSILENEATPDLDILQSYGAVIWLTGDYCCTAPSEEGSLVLEEYVAGGGRLLISGLAVAADWAGTDFLFDTLGADFVSYSPQLDIEIGESHPINLGFEDVILTFDTEDTVQPDIIIPTGNGTIIFVRGPESTDAGEACMIAYESGDARVAFASFPVTLLSDDDLALLLFNTTFWLLGF
jgi:hypothetical protein